MAEEGLLKKSWVTPSTMNVEEFNLDIESSAKKVATSRFFESLEPVITDFSVTLDCDETSINDDVSTPKNHEHLRGRSGLTHQSEDSRGSRTLAPQAKRWTSAEMTTSKSRGSTTISKSWRPWGLVTLEESSSAETN